jgi:transposase
VNPLAGQDEHETLETLFKNVDLSFAKAAVRGCFHTVGPGRPPRNPLGVFRTFIVMKMKGVRSLREMTRLLDSDPRLRKLCLIKIDEAAYPRSVLSRFIRKVGEDNLTRIIEEKVVKLLKRNDAKDVDAVFDASFIKAWSTRHPLDNPKGYSDGDARVGRAGRTFGLGYKLHLSIDSQTMLPLTCVFASANQNEKKHSLNMLEKTKTILKRSAARLRSVIADSQYSDSKLRNAVDETVIPYPANQKRDVKGLLRVDKKFRTYGPEDQKREYHKRPHIEAVYSFLKTQYSLAVNKVRGLGNVASYALYSPLCLVLNREAAENLGRPDKAVSPTYFNT